MVSISACHAEDPGSIPGRGGFFFFWTKFFFCRTINELEVSPPSQKIKIFVCLTVCSLPSEFLVLSGHLRAYSFCAVFLFRFINRNRNKRVQKEQFSSERNNFHGNKMAHSLIFQTGKVKSTKNYTRTKFEKYGRLFRQTSCLRRPRYLLRSFSSVLELVFMDTIRKWRAAAVLTSVLFEGKVVRKMRNT